MVADDEAKPWWEPGNRTLQLKPHRAFIQAEQWALPNREWRLTSETLRRFSALSPLNQSFAQTLKIIRFTEDTRS